MSNDAIGMVAQSAPEHVASGTAAGPDLQAAAQPRAPILMVDDKPENLMALEAVLDGLGEELVKATSGRDALRFLLERDFAAVLLDVKMPDMDGFETAALIRERERSKNTPILFMTALKSEEHLFRGYYMGAVDYLFKPIVPDILRSKVNVFIELYKKSELLKIQADVLRQKNQELERSIAERIRAEEAIRELNSELEQRVIERTKELTRINDELRQFAYVASHDLQEPLRTVGSYAQLLNKRYRGKLDKDADDFIHYIVDGVQRMHVLLNDMLAYSRVTNDQQNRPHTHCSLNTVLDTALANLEASIKESGADITHDGLPTVLADESQMTQVFQNLVSNSIKYRSHEPPRIHISVRNNDAEWVFAVRDNGIGIEPKYLERIFGIFKRLHGKEKPGTGMGLAICKKIVERHGGRIWAESMPGEGSLFQFTIPA
jgi:signal transduction histidine kinase